MIRFHLGHGVDFIVATDNGSSDGTRDYLQLESIHDQAIWVSAMARIATEQSFCQGSLSSFTSLGPEPDYGHLIGDQIMLQNVRESGILCHHVDEASVYYRCGKPSLYRQMGEEPPAGIPARLDYEAS
jgi:hypothetical protein